MNLTKRQQQVYDFMLSHSAKTGNMPTCAEIADHFGWRSHNAAQEHIAALRKKGYLAPKGDKKGRIKLPTIPPVTVSVPDYIMIGDTK